MFLTVSYIDGDREILDLCEFCGEKDDEVSFILELRYVDDDWILLGIFINSGDKWGVRVRTVE